VANLRAPIKNPSGRNEWRLKNDAVTSERDASSGPSVWLDE